MKYYSSLKKSLGFLNPWRRLNDQLQILCHGVVKFFRPVQFDYQKQLISLYLRNSKYSGFLQHYCRLQRRWITRHVHTSPDIRVWELRKTSHIAISNSSEALFNFICFSSGLFAPTCHALVMQLLHFCNRCLRLSFTVYQGISLESASRHWQIPRQTAFFQPKRAPTASNHSWSSPKLSRMYFQLLKIASRAVSCPVSHKGWGTLSWC